MFGTAQCPRASVFRSLSAISAQLIDDVRGRTLVAVTSATLPERKSDKHVTVAKLKQAEAVGRELARQAMALGIRRIVFDRGGYRYHGRVKAVAEALRAGGVRF